MLHILEPDQRVLHQVPPDYYQEGVRKNPFQRIWHMNKLAATVELVKAEMESPVRILDVGCASGWFLSELVRRMPGASGEGVDAYKNAIEFGRKKYPALKLKTADVHEMPYPDGRFDLIVCAEVLEHVRNPQMVLREIGRLMTPEGIAVIEMDTGNLLFRTVWSVWTGMRGKVWADAHIQEFNADKLERMIREAGFRIVARKTFNWTMGIAFCVKKGR